MLRYEELPGCCGVTVYHHFNDVDGTRWTFGNLARALSAPGNLLSQEDFVRPIITFVHSSTQDNEPMSPRRLAEWLTERREPIQTMPVVQHDRHGTRLTMYTWQPTQQFRDQLYRSLERHGLNGEITYRPGQAPVARPAGAEAAREAAAQPRGNLPPAGNRPGQAAPRTRR